MFLRISMLVGHATFGDWPSSSFPSDRQTQRGVHLSFLIIFVFFKLTDRYLKCITFMEERKTHKMLSSDKWNSNFFFSFSDFPFVTIKTCHILVSVTSVGRNNFVKSPSFIIIFCHIFQIRHLLSPDPNLVSPYFLSLLLSF